MLHNAEYMLQSKPNFHGAAFLLFSSDDGGIPCCSCQAKIVRRSLPKNELRTV